jgi:hypothetical protein
MSNMENNWHGRMLRRVQSFLMRFRRSGHAGPQPANVVTPDAAEVPRAAMPKSLTALLSRGSVHDAPKVVGLVEQTLRTGVEAADWRAIVLTAHRNGHVRERAIGSLAAEFDNGSPHIASRPIELGLLLLRLNDWVPPVQLAAEALLRACGRHCRRTISQKRCRCCSIRTFGIGRVQRAAR